jgi:selenocysteine lyase/cysteine desulfurase
MTLSPSIFSPEETRTIEREFPYLAERAYLNFASVGPLPVRGRAAIDRIHDTMQRLDRNFDPETFQAVERCRHALARLTGGSSAGLGLVPNTSFGLNWAFAALDLGPGDGVLITDHEFPALAYTAENLREQGVQIITVPVPADRGLDPDRLRAHLVANPQIRVVAVSWVCFHNGYRHDLRALADVAHEHDAYLLVDAIQGLGTRPLDAESTGIDVAASAVHKWLVCPVGQAFVWCHPRLLGRLRSPWGGWLSVDWDTEFSQLFDTGKPLPPGPRRAEVGTYAFAAVRAVAEVSEWLVSLGPDRIRAHTDALLSHLERNLDHERFEVVSDRSADHRSAIFCLRPRGGDATALKAHLQRSRIVCALREGAVRLSPHFPTRGSDIEQLVQSLHEFA